MLSYLLLMTLVLSVSIGNLALGFGLAVHLGHGPAGGWQALCFWKKSAASDASHAAAHEAPAAEHAAAHH
jgi:hypothetical protein